MKEIAGVKVSAFLHEKSKSPLLAKNARNGAPSLVANRKKSAKLGYLRYSYETLFLPSF